MSRRNRMVAVVVTVPAAAIVFISCGSGSSIGPRLDDPQLQLGREVYDDQCATCHGDSGQGGVGPALGDGEVVRNLPIVEEHRRVVVEGRNRMPAWGESLSDEEIDAVVRYEREVLGR